jgi:hypothetical protein
MLRIGLKYFSLSGKIVVGILSCYKGSAPIGALFVLLAVLCMKIFA